MKLQQKTRAVFYTLICVALWGLIPVVSKLGQSTLDNHQFLFWSSLVSFVVLCTSTLVVKKIPTFGQYSITDWAKAVGLGFLGTYLYYILLYFGYAKAQGLEILVLQYSWPIFIIILSIIILKEKLTFKKSFAAALGFVGVLLVLTKGNFTEIRLDNYFVDFLVIIAAITFALFSVLSKKVESEPYTLNTIYFFTATIASLFSMFALSTFSFPTWDSLIPILINGIFINGFSYVLWIKALKLTEASFIAPFVFLTPILSAVYLIVFFQEPFLPVYGLGLISVIAGGLLNTNQKATKLPHST